VSCLSTRASRSHSSISGVMIGLAAAWSAAFWCVLNYGRARCPKTAFSLWYLSRKRSEDRVKNEMNEVAGGPAADHYCSIPPRLVEFDLVKDGPPQFSGWDDHRESIVQFGDQRGSKRSGGKGPLSAT